MKSLIALSFAMKALAGAVPPQATSASTSSSTDVALAFSTIRPEPIVTVTSSIISTSTIDATETIDWLQRPETKTYPLDTKLYAQTTMPTTLSTATVSVRATPKTGPVPTRNPKTGAGRYAVEDEESNPKSDIRKKDALKNLNDLEEKLIPEGLREAWKKLKDLITDHAIEPRGRLAGDRFVPSPDEPKVSAEKGPLEETLIPEDPKDA